MRLRILSDHANRRDQIFYALLALMSGLYVLLSAYTPVSIYSDSALDDELYLVNAQYLAAGNWLGTFDYRTLAKGPGYPMFLAISAWTGLPITISQAIFTCLAAAAMALVVKRLSGSRLLAFAIALLVLWNPALVQLGINREAIYPAQTVLFIAILTHSLFSAAGWRTAATWGAIAGLVLGWLWLTREEGLWIIPAVVMLPSSAALYTWWRARNLRLPATAALSMLCCFGLTIVIFRYINFTAYGSFVGVDFKEPNFVGACQALQNVRVGKPIPYLPVSRPARLKIYEVSPAFASLRKYLDPPGRTVVQSGCAWYPWTCGDIAGGWFFWALRDAAAQEGHYETPAAAADFFGRLRDQVVTACHQGLLACDNWKLGQTPHLNVEQISQIPQTVLDGLHILLFGIPPSVVGVASSGPPDVVIKNWRFLNRPVHLPMAGTTSVQEQLAKFSAEERSWLGRPIDEIGGPASPGSCVGQFDAVSHEVVGGGAPVNGWAWSLGEKIAPKRIVLADPSGIIVGLASGGSPRPDVVAAHVGISDSATGWQGFSKAARSVSAYAIINGVRNRCRLTGTFDIVAQPIADQELDPSIEARVRFALATRALLIEAYEFLLPPLFWLGLLAMAVSLFVMSARRSLPDPILWLAITVWVLLPGRLLLLAIIHVSSFPAMYDRYLAPLYPLITVASLLSIWIAINQIGQIGEIGQFPQLRVKNQ